MNVTDLVQSSGYSAVFGLVAVESLGIPIPGETALVAAGIYAGHTHHLNPWPIFAVGAAGAIIGDNIGYLIGAMGGYRLARRYGGKVRLDEAKLKVGRYVFDRHGAKVVFFGRFVLVLRTYAAFLAGTSKMAWRKFLPANGTGGLLWAGIFTFASYEAGSSFEHISGGIDLVLGVIGILVVIGTLVALRMKTAQLTALAEAAYPGLLE